MRPTTGGCGLRLEDVAYDSGMVPRPQNSTFTASCTTRGSPAVVIVPKSAAPNTALGLPSGGVLSRLNASARSSSAVPAPTGTRRLNARSTFLNAGPRTGVRDAEPSVNWGAAPKAAVLNHPEGERPFDA